MPRIDEIEKRAIPLPKGSALKDIPEAGSQFERVIKRVRSEKDPKDFRKNIKPNLAEMVPLPSDLRDLMDLAKMVATNPEARKVMTQEIKRGLSDLKKDPVGTVKKAAISNPVDTAGLLATGGLAGLRAASYRLPLHVRSYLRSMAHIPTTQKKLPKRLEAVLEEDIDKNLELLLSGNLSGEAPKIKKAKDIAAHRESAELKRRRNIGTSPEETVSPSVERSIEKGLFKPEEEIIPIPHTIQNKELGNTLGKYFLALDPKQKDIIVKDLYKFYDIFESSSPFGSLKRSLKRQLDNFLKEPRPEKLKRLKNLVLSSGTSEGDIFERLGIVYGGEFPIEYRLPINNPKRAEIQNKINALRIKQLVDPEIQSDLESYLNSWEY